MAVNQLIAAQHLISEPLTDISVVLASCNSMRVANMMRKT